MKKTIVVCIFSILLNFISRKILFFDDLFYNTFSEKVSYERIEKFIQDSKKLEWLSYVTIPIIYLIKFAIIATCLSIGYYFSASHFNFKKFWHVAVQAEFIFLLPILIKLLWFLFVQTDYDLNDLSQFYPLSALNLFDIDTLEPYWLYPLQLLNVFELAYWFLLAYGIMQATDWSYERSMSLVLYSYGTGLLLWVSLVMFLSVTYLS